MMNRLAEISAELVQAVEAIGGAIVRVVGRQRVAASGLAWSTDGLIVTANHVLEREVDLLVGSPAGEELPAVLLGRDPSTDLALLRVEGLRLPLPERASGPLAVGQLVLAVARPGRGLQAAIGILSALGGSWQSPAGGEIDRYLQTDVVMYPGFSGGALVDGLGRVLGMNTSDLLRGYTVAVPMSTVDRVAAQLAAEGRIRSGFLGISVQPVRLPERWAIELGQESGTLVQSVAGGGPASLAGVATGDILVAFDGHPIRNLDDLARWLNGERVGQIVLLRLLRSGRLMDLAVTVGERR